MGLRHITLQPLRPWQSIVFTAAPALVAYFAMWTLAPSFKAHTGQPFLVGYLISWLASEAVILSAAVIAYRVERRTPGWREMLERYRLRSPTRGDLGWALITVTVMVATYFALSSTSRWLAQSWAFSPHPAFPAELRPGAEQAIVPGVFMEMQLKGVWWVLIVYLLGWVLNIAGEELWFRGFMLPRQEVTHGKVGWLVNGICFTLFHIMWKWNLIALLPGSLFLSYATQRRRNTWTAILAHGLLNLTTAVAIAAGVAGIGAA
ncbi:MAG TPA: CPBP family intramembrane glutamic endopeptidase [Anaerolineales bacterium]|nr:CPBP family intramembrane glutamic endopeptidase [Anaerolineales bacterium]